MRFIIQRVTQARVTVEGKTVGEIGNGFLVLVGVCQGDDRKVADRMVRKLCGLRIFEDENGKTNLSLKDVGGEMLIVSQFTLYADCKKGYRPSFVKAGDPALAEELYEYILEETGKEIPMVQHGVFGAHMEVSLVNHGPFTVLLDSTEI